MELESVLIIEMLFLWLYIKSDLNFIFALTILNNYSKAPKVRIIFCQILHPDASENFSKTKLSI